MKITKEEFDSLYSENITKKQYDTIIEKIDERVSEICIKILSKKTVKWFDYDNCNYDSENSSGFFDPSKYRLKIYVGGEFGEFPKPFENCFPTRWLWEDFEAEFNSEVEKYKLKILEKKEKEKMERLVLKNKKDEFKQIIQSKLTKEELRYIKFK